MTPTIVLMGAGGIGSRHVQGLTTMQTPARLHVVDPSPASLRTARERLGEVDGDSSNLEAEFGSLDDPIPETVDLAIVATGSMHRRGAIERLVGSSSVRYLVLEKFLFPAVDDFDVVGGLLQREVDAAWVNCPRRLWPGYRAMATEIGGDEAVSVRVTAGERFGLATTAIHFLDLTAFLAGTDRFSVDSGALDPGVVPAPREGYIEMTGCLRATSDTGASMEYRCEAGSEPVVHVDVLAGERRWAIDETGGTWTSSDAPTPEPFPMPFQSQLSGSVADEILGSGDCGLTPYDESALLHRPVLEALLAHYRAAGHEEARLCPIT